jgi:hypothetical protein
MWTRDGTKQQHGFELQQRIATKISVRSVSSLYRTMAMFHVGAGTEHWLELWTGTGTEFLRLENVPTLYMLQNCKGAGREL